MSKINSNYEKQIMLLMIPNRKKEGWRYLAVKNLSALLNGIILKHKGDFCGTVMPSEKENLLEFDQYMKSEKMPYIIFVNFESLIKKKKDRYTNNPGKFSTTKLGQHIPVQIFSASYIDL